MKDNTSKSGRSKKQAKERLKKTAAYEKYQLKNKTNVFVIIMSSIVVLFLLIWLLTGFGIGISYYLFKTDHYVWASLIILFDLVLIGSYIKTKN